MSGATLTTADVAQALEVTRHGVRYLVQAGELRPTLTPATGQWLFARVEVLAVAAARTRRRLRSRGEVWRALRIVARQAEPRQLALPLYGVGRKVTTRARSEPRVIRPERRPGLISAVMDSRGAARRMAKADLHDRPQQRAGGRRR